MTLRKEREENVKLEREVLNLRKLVGQLEKEIKYKDELLAKSGQMHKVELESLNKQLSETLELFVDSEQKLTPSTPATSGQRRGSFVAPDPVSSQPLARRTRSSVRKSRIQFVHQCDECSFETKSDVSVILHKMNHAIPDEPNKLAYTSFTTRNFNSKAIYNCPACDAGVNLTRHEVYRHV